MVFDRRIGRQRPIGAELLPGGVERRLSRPDGIAGVRDLLVGHGPRHAGGESALQVVLCLRKIRLAFSDICTIFVIVDIQAMDSANGLAQIGLGLLQGNPGIRGVDLDDRLTFLDDLRIVRIDPDDGARDLGCDLHDVTVHVGVVGIYVIAGVEEIVSTVSRPRDRQGSYKQYEQEFALAGFLCRLVSRRWLRGVHR
jgi:hypothetical protein